jgi:uroporphyrinogen III methyltransferase/synthase
MKVGKVYLVGAGPGDPGLMTVKGLDCLRRADVVIYDRLIDESILHEARPEAEKIYVGKASSHHTLEQETINHLLIQKAREGKVVVRLKGGDPFVLGRGGEEAEALAENHIPFEVVPGRQLLLYLLTPVFR